MTKRSFNLRKVATIVACLVVTTMFASCDKPNGDDDPENGNSRTLTAEDKKFVGHWEAGWGGSLGQADEQFRDTKNVTEDYTAPYGHGFHFYDDGTFKYVMAYAVRSGINGNIMQNGVTIWHGKFRAENEKLYFTSMTYSYIPRANDPSGIKEYRNRSANNSEWKYVFGRDIGGDYVQINITEKENFEYAEKFYDMKNKTPLEYK